MLLLRSFCGLSCFLGLLLVGLGAPQTSNAQELFKCQKSLQKTARIGVVFDSGSPIGKQQKVAMKMAFPCLELEPLHLHDSPASSSGLDLITNGEVKAIVGSVTILDLIVISDHKIPVGVPIVSTSTAQLRPLKIPPLIQIANYNINHRMKCIASILTHFQWRKVTIFHEITNNIVHPSTNPSILAHRLSDSFRSVNVEIEQVLTLSPSSSIDQELKKVMNNQRKGIFMVTQFSLEMAVLLLTKAKKLNLVGNGYVWIVSDDVFDLIETSNSSFLNEMEGLIGFRTSFDSTKNSFRSFEAKFKKAYNLEYPNDEQPAKASMFAVRAYDASRAIARAIESLGENFISSDQLREKILRSNFEGLSGRVRFKNNGMLILQSPKFQIIKVVGRSNKEIAFWTSKLGFVERSVEVNKAAATKIKPNNVRNYAAIRDLSRLKKLAKKNLKFAVPKDGACHEFVTVSKNLDGNYIATGFSIDVFNAVMSNMPYLPSHELVPFTGTYNDMIEAVHNKTYDGAVGDIGMLAYRYRHVDFTAAYLEADIVMVVTEKKEKWKKIWAFMDAFQLNMWLLIPTMHLFISFVIWIIERQNNDELKGVGNMLWFSVSIIFFMHREPVKNGLARLVLGPWLFAILVVTTSFTASLTSMMTKSWSEPSVLDVETLRKMGAQGPIGCNSNSFICTYLNETLGFEQGRIKKINSIDDYPDAFENGTIKAAFLISPQAKVFLAKYCKGYTTAASSYKFNGIGFAFPKGSALAVNVSASIAELTERKQIPQLETNVLASFNCSSTDQADGQGLGPGPFLGLFSICGTIAFLVLLYMGLQLLTTKMGSIEKPNKAQQALPPRLEQSKRIGRHVHTLQLQQPHFIIYS
ncbi:glutamate receptor 2.5-like [Momordica charantia]|uniref:Glutamate receptor 2.5-like n=1 Tax=Momordica charantia TaxID=3673 RepID=A0A6J1CSK9_MOMCH|nr:glutamate receptor 2.5-like [Momordica charantia]